MAKPKLAAGDIVLTRYGIHPYQIERIHKKCAIVRLLYKGKPSIIFYYLRLNKLSRVKTKM